MRPVWRALARPAVGAALAMGCLFIAPGVVATANGGGSGNCPTTPCLSGPARLSLNPTQAAMGRPLTADYQLPGAHNCNGNVVLTWRGPTFIDSLGSAPLTSSCSARWQGYPPLGSHGFPGTYEIDADLSSGPSTTLTAAVASYTVLPPDGRGSLTATPDTGRAGSSVTLSYTYKPADACPGGTAEFFWDTSKTLLGQIAIDPATCTAAWTGVPSTSTPGDYPVAASLDPGDGAAAALATATYRIEPPVVGTPGLSLSQRNGLPGASLTAAYSRSGGTCFSGGTDVRYFLGGSSYGTGVELGTVPLTNACDASWAGTIPSSADTGATRVWASVVDSAGTPLADSGVSAAYTVDSPTSGSGSTSPTPTDPSAPPAIDPANPAIPSGPADVVILPPVDPPTATTGAHPGGATASTGPLGLAAMRPLQAAAALHFGAGILVWLILGAINLCALAAVLHVRRRWSEQIVD